MSLVTYTEMPAVVNHEEVFSIVNYNVSDEIDEGYSTNYSPSSKSSSSFECDTSFERTENVSNDVQVHYVTGHIGERVEDEKGNMMWLVDFKLDFLNDIEKTGEKRGQEFVPLDSNKRIKLCEVQDTCLPVEDHEAPLNLSHFSHHSQSQPQIQPQLQPPPSASVVTEPEMVQEGSKPNYTYTDLITLALKDKTALTVSGIYNWITENFPYYKAEDDRWKNSVRHNLSMNPNFRKGGRAKQGTGHVWVLADVSDLRPQVGLHIYNVYGLLIIVVSCCRKVCQKTENKTRVMRPSGKYYSRVFLKALPVSR